MYENDNLCFFVCFGLSYFYVVFALFSWVVIFGGLCGIYLHFTLGSPRAGYSERSHVDNGIIKFKNRNQPPCATLLFNVGLAFLIRQLHLAGHSYPRSLEYVPGKVVDFEGDSLQFPDPSILATSLKWAQSKDWYSYIFQRWKSWVHPHCLSFSDKYIASVEEFVANLSPEFKDKVCP